MSTYTAAYCSACGAYVLLSAQGDCVFGHPRSSLRGIYQAARSTSRTGHPKPPTAEQRAASLRPAAPVAPIALSSAVRPAAAWPLQSQQASEWSSETSPVPERRLESEPATDWLSNEQAACATTPLAPVIKAMGSRIPRALLLSDMHAVFGRLFGPPRGRHSAGVAAIGPLPGRHSAK